MRKLMWGLLPKARSPKGWIIIVVTALLLVGALSSGLFGFSSRGPQAAHAQSATGGIWSQTSPLPAARSANTATLLPSGKVLVAGGTDGTTPQATAYLYDPATATWTATGSMLEARAFHTATLLANGEVLVAGGLTPNGVRRTAELYNPATGTWTATGSMLELRVGRVATLLPNGKVLVTGGASQPGGLSAITAGAELYNPATGTWTATGSMLTARTDHTQTLLPNGKVLVAGGRFTGNTLITIATAELYDPTTGTWTFAGRMLAARYFHTATLLPNGKVLVAGGFTVFGVAVAADLYDPTAGTWTETNSMLTNRIGHTATLLPNGKVLVAGGSGLGGIQTAAELYDPTTGAWTATGSMLTAREFHTATLLPNGKVLVVGGGATATASAELFEP